MAADVIQVIEKLDLRDAILVGHSMGGMITQQMCLDFPDAARERVAGTILLSTAAAPGQGVPGFKLVNRLMSPGAMAVARRQASRGAGLLPPAPGTYRYDTSGSSVFALATVAYPAVSTLVVDPPAGTRQHSARDLRDAAGNGPLIELSVDYRPDGIYVEGLRLTTGFSGVTNSQDLRPPSPQLLVPTDAVPGTHLEYDLSSGGATAHLVIDIGGRQTLAVGGRSVEAVPVHMVASLAPGAVTGRLDLTAWLAPSVRLWVKEHFVLDAAAAGGALTLHSQYDATLQRLP